MGIIISIGLVVHLLLLLLIYLGLYTLNNIFNNSNVFIPLVLSMLISYLLTMALLYLFGYLYLLMELPPEVVLFYNLCVFGIDFFLAMLISEEL